MNDAIAPIRSLHFRQVPEGWLYRSPSLWVFSRPDHYIVNEAQKTAIEQLLPRASKPTRRRILIWTSACIAVLAALLGAAFLVAPDFPVTAVTTLTAVTLVGSIFALHLSAKSQLRRLRPILADATPTDQMITIAEMQRHLQSGVTYAQARRGGFASAFAAIGMLAFVAVSNVYAAEKWRADRRHCRAIIHILCADDGPIVGVELPLCPREEERNGRCAVT